MERSAGILKRAHPTQLSHPWQYPTGEIIMIGLIQVSTDLKALIARTIDKSDPLMRRVCVEFTNGYALSIVQGTYSYGGDQGLYEIAPINPANALDGSLFDEEDQGDDVLGYCDLEKINHYVRKLAYLPAIGETHEPRA